MVDDVDAPNDTPVSYLRSSMTVRGHWNAFHVSWRDWFVRYIFSYTDGDWQGTLQVRAWLLLGSRNQVIAPCLSVSPN